MLPLSRDSPSRLALATQRIPQTECAKQRTWIPARRHPTARFPNDALAAASSSARGCDASHDSFTPLRREHRRQRHGTGQGDRPHRHLRAGIREVVWRHVVSADSRLLDEQAERTMVRKGGSRPACGGNWPLRQTAGLVPLRRLHRNPASDPVERLGAGRSGEDAARQKS